jgi:hypothetical protein
MRLVTPRRRFVALALAALLPTAADAKKKRRKKHRRKKDPPPDSTTTIIPPPECTTRENCPAMATGQRELCCNGTCCNANSWECDFAYRVDGAAAGEACCAARCCTRRCYFDEGFPGSTHQWKCGNDPVPGAVCT